MFLLLFFLLLLLRTRSVVIVLPKHKLTNLMQSETRPRQPLQKHLGYSEIAKTDLPEAKFFLKSSAVLERVDGLDEIQRILGERHL